MSLLQIVGLTFGALELAVLGFIAYVWLAGRHYERGYHQARLDSADDELEAYDRGSRETWDALQRLADQRQLDTRLAGQRANARWQ